MCHQALQYNCHIICIGYFAIYNIRRFPLQCTMYVNLLCNPFTMPYICEFALQHPILINLVKFHLLTHWLGST